MIITISILVPVILIFYTNKKEPLLWVLGVVMCGLLYFILSALYQIL